MVAATTSTVPVSMDAERHQFNVSSGLRKPLQSKLDLGEMLVHQVSVFHARAALGVPAIAREFGEADNAVSPTSHALCTPVAKAGGAAGAAWAVRRDLGWLGVEERAMTVPLLRALHGARAPWRRKYLPHAWVPLPWAGRNATLRARTRARKRTMLHDIVLLGGSGFVGSRLCELLIAQRDGAPGRITVATRGRARARHLQILPGVEVQEADVHDDGVLAGLVAGRGAIVNLVGILHGDQAAFSRVHAALPRRVAVACREAGVQRLVHVSALGADGGAPSMYLRSKAEGESAIAGGGVPGAVLRPSVMFGERDRFLNLFARLSRFAPVIPLAGAGARFQPVWVDDVARAIVACLQAAPPASPVYECAGPQVYTLMELVRRAGRYSGHERLIIPLPAAVAECQAWFMEQLPGEPLISRDNLASMQVPSVASGRLPGLAELGISPASLDAVAPGYLVATAPA